MEGMLLGLFNGPVSEKDAIEKFTEDAIKVAKLGEKAEQRLKRALELVDMEEQGRLVVLPCKVGDTLYYAPERYARCDYGPEPISVEEVNSYSGTIVVECYLDPDTRVSVNTWDFGKTVFLTREEAEKALKEGAK